MVHETPVNFDISRGNAAILKRKGGDEFVNGTSELVKKYGELMPGGCASSSAGKMDIKHIIHVSAPAWDENTELIVHQENLRNCFINIL